MALAEESPGDPAVGEVVEYGQGRVQPLVVEGFEVGLDGGVEDQSVASRAGQVRSVLSHEWCGHAGARSSW